MTEGAKENLFSIDFDSELVAPAKIGLYWR